MTMRSAHRILLSAILLAGCAAAPAPPLSATHPASPDAPAGARIARQSSLRTDDPTRKSHELLSAAKKEQEHWDDYGPVSGTPEDAPKSNAESAMSHDHSH